MRTVLSASGINSGIQMDEGVRSSTYDLAINCNML